MARRREKRECRAVVLEPVQALVLDVIKEGGPPAVVLEPDAADMTSTPFLIHLLKVPYTPTLPRHHQL